MKKLLIKFEHVWQADAVKSLLAEKQIAYYEIKKSREYVSILTGIGQGAFEIYVQDDMLPLAQTVLTNYLKQTSLHLVDDSDENRDLKVRPNYFRRVIFLSVSSLVFLPIVFNYLAYLNFKKLLNSIASERQKNTALVVLIICFALALLEAVWILKILMNMFKVN